MPILTTFPGSRSLRSKGIPPVPSLIEYLVVGGGGGGGAGSFSGGGGAGGYISTSVDVVAGQTFSISVGSGGAAGSNGQPSSLGATTALGGGYGGNSVAWDTGQQGGAGGSGGGGPSTYGSYTTRNPGSGTGGQGRDGAAGASYDFGSRSYNAGGGGGAGGVGVGPAPGGTGGTGGPGLQWLDGNYYAGGGGGGIYWEWNYGTSSPESVQAQGGLGGGGKGNRSVFGSPPSLLPSDGIANTGGGGGGGGGIGGSGVVILRYPNTKREMSTIPAGLVYDKISVGGYYYYTFKSGSGTIAV